ncbi:hypothetical protein JHK82_024367 [Glycine max]|nr:hypothetical protein JHK82_024367 [Glycine max]
MELGIKGIKDTPQQRIRTHPDNGTLYTIFGGIYRISPTHLFYRLIFVSHHENPNTRLRVHQALSTYMTTHMQCHFSNAEFNDNPQMQVDSEVIRELCTCINKLVGYLGGAEDHVEEIIWLQINNHLTFLIAVTSA